MLSILFAVLTSTAPMSYDDLDGLDLVLDHYSAEYDDPDYLEWETALDVGVPLTINTWADRSTWKEIGE